MRHYVGFSQIRSHIEYLYESCYSMVFKGDTIFLWRESLLLSTTIPRVNNKREECLTLYRPVIDDCAEVKRLPFHVTYRVLVFVRFLTAICLAAP